MAQPFDLVGISNAVGAPLLRSLQGRDWGMHASRAFDRSTTTNHIAHAALPPTLAKNARMGHPLLEWRTQKPLSVGHPPLMRVTALQYRFGMKIKVVILAQARRQESSLIPFGYIVMSV